MAGPRRSSRSRATKRQTQNRDQGNEEEIDAGSPSHLSRVGDGLGGTCREGDEKGTSCIFWRG